MVGTTGSFFGTHAAGFPPVALREIDRGQALKAQEFAELLHREGRAGIVLALGRNVLVATDVVELVAFDQCFRGGEAGIELRLRILFPKRDGAAVLVFGADGAGFASMFPKRLRFLDRARNAVAGICQLNADRERVAPVPDSVRRIFPAA